MSVSHRICVICDVRERCTSEKLFFARFPLDEYRCKQWVKLVGNEDLLHLPIEKLHELRYICGKHFEKRDFTKTKTRLKKRAVPKLHLNLPPLPDALLEGFPSHIAGTDRVVVPLDAEVDLELPSTSSQVVTISMSPTKVQPIAPSTSRQPEMPSTGVQLEVSKIPSDNTTVVVPVESEEQPSTSVRTQVDLISKLTIKKEKLMKDLMKTKCTLRSLRKSAALVEKLESPILKEIVLNATKKRKPKGRRWTMENKISALAIFKKSPKTYRYLSQVLPLPSQRTLKNILKNVPMETME